MEEPNPFRQTSSGFESLIPRDGAEDFFFAQWIATPESAAEFLEHGEESRDALLGDTRSGIGVSAVLHIVLLGFLLFEPKLNELLGFPPESEEVATTDEPERLKLFFQEEPPAEPPVAVVPVVPVVPVPPEATPATKPPQVADNRLIIPKAMIQPDTRPEIMNDLPFSKGNTDEFYTKEEVKDPGTEGDPGENVEPSPMASDDEGSGDDDIASEEAEGTDVADGRMDPEELSDFIFGERDPEESAREEAREKRQLRPTQPTVTATAPGEGGENGRFTDIRRFLAGAQFHNPEGGLVVNSDNTMYYNDKGADFVPWIRRMLHEVGRTWRASMPVVAMWDHGHVAVGFTVAQDGTVIDYRTLVPSGVTGFDSNAVGAIRASRLLPLPDDYPDPTFDIILVFWYNERPYDIFG